MRMPVARSHASKVGLGRVSPAETHLSRVEMFVVLDRLEQGPVHGRRGEQRAHAVALDGFQQQLRRGPLDQHGRGAGMHRKRDQRAEAEGEGDGRRAQEHVVRARLQHVAREGVADRHDVAVEMHAPLGRAGGAGGEGDDRDIVARGGDIVEVGRHAGHRAVERGAASAVVIDHPLQPRGAGQGLLHLRVEAQVAQRVPHLRPVADVLQLAGAQQRHGRHRHRPRLEHREPAGDEHRVVRPAQQDPLAGLDAELAGQQVGDAVGRLPQARIAPGLAIDDVAGTLAASALDPRIEELGGGVHARRIGGELRHCGRVHRRPLLAWRQVVARKAVGMEGGLERAHGRVAVSSPRAASRWPRGARGSPRRPRRAGPSAPGRRRSASARRWRPRRCAARGPRGTGARPRRR